MLRYHITDSIDVQGTNNLVFLTILNLLFISDLFTIKLEDLCKGIKSDHCKQEIHYKWLCFTVLQVYICWLKMKISYPQSPAWPAMTSLPQASSFLPSWTSFSSITGQCRWSSWCSGASVSNFTFFSCTMLKDTQSKQAPFVTKQNEKLSVQILINKFSKPKIPWSPFVKHHIHCINIKKENSQ